MTNATNGTPGPAPVYSVTIQRTFRGREGDGYNAKLLRDGKVVALVDDDASGGMLRFDWKDRAAPRVAVTVERYGTDRSFMATPEEALLEEYCKTLPNVACVGVPDGLRQNPDLFVDGLAVQALQRRDLKQAMARKTLFAGGGKVWEAKGVGAAVEAAVRAKYPEARILNALPLDEALELYAAAGDAR